MTLDSAELAGSSHTDPGHPAQVATGPFMLTLCRLAAPVSIQPPQSPQLKPFTFFMSRAPQPDGSERLYLHMGYFESLNDAERWAQLARARYPHAIATIAPAPRSTNSSQGSVHAPVDAAALSDTQVLKMLETRRAVPAQEGADERNCEQIALLRPEDTSTRQALKEAVVQGAPVSFAVQLDFSARPIDLSRVPALAMFKAHILYATESRREGRSRYFLRLGFFTDPVSAKQVAVQVRSKFASAAVVPVVEQEVTRAREAGSGSSLPYLEQPRLDQGVDSSGMSEAPTQSKPAPAPRKARGAPTLQQTLRELAERESWTDPDSLSESGVRHLRVEVQEHSPGSRRS
jgi:hypothetical protein